MRTFVRQNGRTAVLDARSAPRRGAAQGCAASIMVGVPKFSISYSPNSLSSGYYSSRPTVGPPNLAVSTKAESESTDNHFKLLQHHFRLIRWIPVQHRPKAILELVEMLFVIPPVLQRAAVNRLANLFGACRTHCALGLMELQTRFFEW